MSTPTLTELLNRLAVKVQPKQKMLDEFGTIVTEAFAAKYINEDFYNYGITDLGMKKRSVLRVDAVLRPGQIQPKPIQPPAPYSVMAEPFPAPNPVPREDTVLKSQANKMIETILNLISAQKESDEGLTAAELEAEMNISRPTLRNRLNELLEANQIVRVGEGLPNRPFRYCTPEQAAVLEEKTPPPELTEPVVTEPVVTKPVVSVSLEEVQAAYSEQPVAHLPPRAITEKLFKQAREFQTPLLEQPAGTVDSEIHAMQSMLTALEPLGDHARSRAIGWVSSRLGLC